MQVVRTLVLLAALSPLPCLAQDRQEIPEPTACNADNESCQEGCTLEFGTSFRTRQKLAACLLDCKTKHQQCTTRWFDVHSNKLDPGALDDRPGSTEPAVAPAPSPAPSPRAEPVPAPVPADDRIIMPTEEQLRSGPAEREQKKKKNEKPIPPSPPSEPFRPELPADPQEDLSEWDPDSE